MILALLGLLFVGFPDVQQPKKNIIGLLVRDMRDIYKYTFIFMRLGRNVGMALFKSLGRCFAVLENSFFLK